MLKKKAVPLSSFMECFEKSHKVLQNASVGYALPDIRLHIEQDLP
jgi:hypothetical protein